MKRKLTELLNKEDKKNPLTDEELAKRLFINRSELTQLRLSYGIPDSRERRKALLVQEIEKILRNAPDISERSLTARINASGFSVSRFSVAKLIKEASPSKTEKSLPAQRDEGQIPNHPFVKIIGWDRSLKVKIEQAKAAVLYPPNGLHTLIVGATGVGKSQLAEAMHSFALLVKKITVQEFPMVIFNCADYAENPQLLLAQLFGYKKGAFTGAEADKDGLVAKADGGILFLDEVHRLPPDGQEILFQLIDKGTYRKLGEAGENNVAKVMIIGATSEDLETSLLTTFRRRIPMIIEIPPLSMRPIQEKREIIRNFFQNEAVRLQKKVIVNHNTIDALLRYEGLGNIGQLRSDIQVACARGFLAYMTKGNGQDCIEVDLQSLPVHVTKGLLLKNWKINLEDMDTDDLIFFPDKSSTEHLSEDLFSFANNVYRRIEEGYKKLQSNGLPDEVIHRIITEDLETRLRKIVNKVDQSKAKLGREDFYSTLRPEVVDLLNVLVKGTEGTLGEMEDTLFYCLATHINAAVERIKSGQQILNPQLSSIKKDYPEEFRVAGEMADYAQTAWNIEFPGDEIGIIAMYLRTLTRKKQNQQNTIGMVILMHGHVARAMANVANRLLGVDYVKAVEMLPEDKPEEIYQKTLDTVKAVNRGKGVLLLVDMGYLTEFGRMIAAATGIRIRTIVRVDTLLVIEALRKTISFNLTIDQLTVSLLKGKRNDRYLAEDFSADQIKEEAIICLCITGEGTAKRLKEILDPLVQTVNRNIRIVTLGMLDEQDILEQIEQINGKMKVLALVGTMNPNHIAIPFIPAAEILQGSGCEQLSRIIQSSLPNPDPIKGPDRTPKKSVYHPELILVNHSAAGKTQVIRTLCAVMAKKGYVSHQFVTSVLEREEIGSTALKPYLAIPHGNYEDILKPAVGIVTLKDPIIWDGQNNQVKIVFLLALNETFKEEFQRLYKLLRNHALIDSIAEAATPGEVFGIVSEV